MCGFPFIALAERQLNKSHQINLPLQSIYMEKKIYINIYIQISFSTTTHWELSTTGWEDSEGVITLSTTRRPFIMRPLGVCLWCISWLPGAVVSLCTLQLNEPISRGQRSRLRRDVKAFMLRYQEELASCEIQIGFCHRWLCTAFHMSHWDTSINA